VVLIIPATSLASKSGDDAFNDSAREHNGEATKRSEEKPPTFDVVLINGSVL
jgi:hypothetical protein